MVDAGLSVDAVLKQLAGRVYVVYHCVSVEPRARGEHRYFVIFVHLHKHLFGVWPYVEGCIYDVTLLGGDCQSDVSLLNFILVSHTVS